jgi:hypothetical protein
MAMTMPGCHSVPNKVDDDSPVAGLRPYTDPQEEPKSIPAWKIFLRRMSL